MENLIAAKLSDLTIGTEFWELVMGNYIKQFPVRNRLDAKELKKHKIHYMPKEETLKEYEAYRQWLINNVNRFYIEKL